MALYKYIRESWNNREDNKKLWSERLALWRRESATTRISYPTRLDRARSLGYKAKKGFVLVRQRVVRGGRMRILPAGGRRSKRASRRKDLNLSYQTVAEIRAIESYPNCEVLNSYYVADDGTYYWYEIILIDRSSPEVLAIPNTKGAAEQRQRVLRGLTASGKRSRGLLNKGRYAEKLRPSKKAVFNRKNRKQRK